MCAADDAPDGYVYGAADHLRHDLLSLLTTISARAQWLARDLRRSPFLPEEERSRLLAGIMEIETAVHALCAVIDTLSDPDRGS